MNAKDNKANQARPHRQRAFYFDQRWCIACNACQMACKDRHDLPVGVNWRRVETWESGRFPRPEVFHLTVSCNHCARPACADACPEGAIAKRATDGLVLLDRARCSRCLSCVDACPYGAMQYDAETGAVGKCDMCADWLERDEPPACVSACVMAVLKAGWLDEMEGEEGQVARGRGLPDPSLTEPAWLIVPHRQAQGS